MVKSEISHARLEELSRHKKSKKIISILSKFRDLKNCSILDIGTGSGHIINDISKLCKSASSVDLYDERMIKSGYSFKKIDDEHLPFENNTFDIVISNHVIEHVPNQKLHLSEIYKVLKNNGILYLATPNKFWVIDPHHKLLFISWFPRKISAFYLKTLKNKKWDIFPLSFGMLKRLTKNKFELNNLTIDIIKYPQKYTLDVMKKLQPLIKLIPVPLLRMFNPILPTYILILKKK